MYRSCHACICMQDQGRILNFLKPIVFLLILCLRSGACVPTRLCECMIWGKCTRAPVRVCMHVHVHVHESAFVSRYTSRKKALLPASDGSDQYHCLTTKDLPYYWGLSKCHNLSLCGCKCRDTMWITSLARVQSSPTTSPTGSPPHPPLHPLVSPCPEL